MNLVDETAHLTKPVVTKPFKPYRSKADKKATLRKEEGGSE